MLAVERMSPAAQGAVSARLKSLPPRAANLEDRLLYLLAMIGIGSVVLAAALALLQP
jgi:hypothetical protein